VVWRFLVKLYGIDCHVATREDHRTLFKKLGHDFRSFSISGHTWVVDESPVVTGTDLKAGLRGIIGGDTVARFQDEWARYFQDENFDAFVVSYPPAFALLFEGLGKPVIMHIPIRYEHPWTHDWKRWETFNQKLRDGIDKGWIIPVANSVYDQKYFEGYVGRKCHYIPSVCSYFPKSRTGTGKGWVSWSHDSTGVPGINDRRVAFGDRYPWSRVVSLRGVVWIPYNVSIMSLFEHYWADLTVLVPSLKLLMDLYRQGKVLQQYSWARMAGSPAALPWTKGEIPDPNDYRDMSAVMHWAKLSDFYTKGMPHIQQFNSMDELALRVGARYTNQRKLQTQDNVDREAWSLNEWKRVFNGIKTDTSKPNP
jgi:hypothetical protein